MAHRNFDQAAYWASRGDRYIEEFAGHSSDTAAILKQQEQEIALILDGVDLSGISTVVELGFGRLTPIVLSRTAAARYIGVDVSHGQIAAAQQAYACDAKPEWLIGDFLTTDIPRADLLFAGEVFLHFPPGKIDAAIEKAHQVSSLIIHADPWLRTGDRHVPLLRLLAHRMRWHGPLHATNWWHDYPQLHGCRGSRVCAVPLLGGTQHIFVSRN